MDLNVKSKNNLLGNNKEYFNFGALLEQKKDTRNQLYREVNFQLKIWYQKIPEKQLKDNMMEENLYLYNS